MKILVFNPEHDLCTAALKANYTPPASARQFAEECCDLMQYLGDEGDICVPASRVGEALKEHPEAEAIVPWGWNITLYGQLLRQGVPENMLCSEKLLEYSTILSNRLLTVQNHFAIGMNAKSKKVCVPPVPAKTIDNIQHYLVHNGAAVLKAPFSGSGHGIRLVKGVLEGKDLLWAEKQLREHGHLLVEHYYDVVHNIAALYKVGYLSVDFVGFSLFDTRGFTYTANHLVSDDFIHDLCEEYVPRHAFDEVIETHQDILFIFSANGFRGPVGIDMFIFRNPDGTFGLNPLVEVNCRYTMGFVAHEILRKHPEHHGKQFKINTPTPENPHYSYSIE